MVKFSIYLYRHVLIVLLDSTVCLSGTNYFKKDKLIFIGSGLRHFVKDLSGGNSVNIVFSSHLKGSALKGNNYLPRTNFFPFRSK